MKRDTRIVLAVLAPVPALILSASALCSWAIAGGATERWRLAFRLLCHGIEARCLELFGVPMPICARCVAIYVGLLAGLAAFVVFPFIREKVLRPVAFLAVMPLAIDGLTQLAGWRESTNLLRISTGLIAGLAFGMWALSAVERRQDEVLTSP